MQILNTQGFLFLNNNHQVKRQGRSDLKKACIMFCIYPFKWHNCNLLFALSWLKKKIWIKYPGFSFFHFTHWLSAVFKMFWNINTSCLLPVHSSPTVLPGVVEGGREEYLFRQTWEMRMVFSCLTGYLIQPWCGIAPLWNREQTAIWGRQPHFVQQLLFPAFC